MADVARWLEDLGLAQYAGTFAENDIDLEVLPHLSEQDLKNLGISLGHRKKLLHAIAALKGSSGTPASPAAEALQPPPRTEAERRQLTVMFVDLVGSTALSASLDPEDMRQVIQSYQECCAEVLKRWDGHIGKYQGDGVIAYFGYPKAHEDDAERAVRAGLQLVDAVTRLVTPAGGVLAARVGVATGRVVVGDLIGHDEARERAVVGETPNLAARLQALAEPGSVVIGPGTHRLVAGLFELADLGAHELKGFGEPVRAWRALGPSRIEGRFEAREAAGLTPLVGREGELTLLLRRWEQAKDGEGQVVLLSGEAGIGKSRLVRAVRERLGHDEPHTVLGYFCSPFYQTSALHPVIGSLERAAGFAPDDPPAQKLEQLKEKTFRALIDQLAGLARQPLLAVYEDVHWSDPTTLELLEQLIDRVQRLPVLVVITFRPEFIPPWPGQAHMSALALNRLSRKQGIAMVAEVTGGRALPDEVLDQIVAKTDGVPLFVEELTKNVLESGLLTDRGEYYALAGPLAPLAIPATLQDSLLARLDRPAPGEEGGP